MFRLINLTTGEYLHNDRTTLSFEDGRKAARASKIASAILKTKIQPRKVADDGDDNWQDRERNRMASGEYIRTAPSFNMACIDANPDHFAHVSKKNPMLIAYTKDEEKGRADKQSLMAIDAYVQEYLAPHFMEDDGPVWLRKAVEAHKNYVATLTNPYKLATTPDEIYSVYTNFDERATQVSNSCMRYDEECNQWPAVGGKRYSPIRIYGAGDLAVAYIANAKGQTVARCLVWPERKLYSRVYGENDALHRALLADGYRKSRYYSPSNDSLSGAKMLKVQDDHGRYICPYLDELQRVDIGPEYILIASEGERFANNTNGVVAGYANNDDDDDDEDSSYCEHCGDNYHDDDMRHVYTTGRMNSSEYWCSGCRDNHAFYCNGEGEYFSDDVGSVEIDGETYSGRYAENRATLCERYDEYTFEPITVITDEDGGTQEWCQSAVDDHAFEYDGDYYSDDIDHTLVVTERYVPRFNHRRAMYYWVGAERIWSPAFNTNVWFVDEVKRIPDFVIRDEEMKIYYTDGKNYLRGYTDNYPVARERMDFDLIDMMEAEHSYEKEAA